MTGSARTEGFYKIDKKDKINYLHSTRLATPSRLTNTQVFVSVASLFRSYLTNVSFKLLRLLKKDLKHLILSRSYEF